MLHAPEQKEEGGDKQSKRGRFRDNDGLAALLAVQLNADLLMLCTDVDGLYTGNPSDPASDFIPTYCPEVGGVQCSAASWAFWPCQLYLRLGDEG